MRKICIILFLILLAYTHSFALESNEAIEQLRNISNRKIIDRIKDGETIPDWARITIPNIDYLEQQAQLELELEHQARMQNSIANKAQPQDAQSLQQGQGRADLIQNNALARFGADTVGAAGIGAANMLNNTVLGGAGLVLGGLGRGIEAISPFSGLDEKATRELERLRAFGYLSRRQLPNTRVYNDSWLTTAAKGTLGLKNKVEDYLQRLRIYALGNNPSELANGMLFTGMLVGLYLLVLILIHNPITKIFLSNYKTIICKFISIKDYIIHYKNIINSPPPPPPPHEEAPRSRQYEAIKLVNLALACIGRKTKRTNLYFTPEREAERHRAEYTFLRQLAEKYRDAATRKVLAQHFMLFKEFCLFIIFSVVLKGDTELHTLVRTELTERLTEDLDIKTKTHRKQYMFAFSKAFYDEYQRTHSMERTLSYSFWSVLADNHPELGTAELSGLGNVYRYSYGVLKNSCK